MCLGSGKWVVTMTFFLAQVTDFNFFQNAQHYKMFEVREYGETFCSV